MTKEQMRALRELVAWAEEQGMDVGTPDERRILSEARAAVMPAMRIASVTSGEPPVTVQVPDNPMNRSALADAIAFSDAVAAGLARLEPR